MRKFFSIRYRIMGLTFLLISITVLCLFYLANRQMEELFYQYLQYQPVFRANRMGMYELEFLHSVHKSLIWVGLFFMGTGLLASYIIAKNITTPLYQLIQAAERIRKGDLQQTVLITRHDEIGELSRVFNQMSQKLAQNEKTRREFLANIAHELQTPLAIVNSHLDSMIDGVETPDMEKLFSMQEEVMRLSRLVKDLRDLSLAEVHQLELHKTATDINALLQRAGDMMTPLFGEKHLQLSYELDPAVPEIYVDTDRMNQVFYNVLVNAVRYTKPCTQIEIKTQRTASHITISIRDHGNGINPKDLPHIFEHFYRSDQSRNRKSGGSGIGLSLARQFVENHEGRIHAENAAGGGVKMVICLPIGKSGITEHHPGNGRRGMNENL